MALTPFDDIPKRAFIDRTIWPAAALFVFLFFCTGVVANSSAFDQPRGPSEVVPFWSSSFQLYQKTWSSLINLPQVCISGNTVSDFQAHQCEEYWDRLVKQGSLAAAPILFLFAVYFLAFDSLSGFYRRARKKIQKGEGSFGGTVTNPPDAPSDFFSWYYCLRPIMVELANKTQLKVYVSSQASQPTPGQTLAVFEAGTVMNQKRHVAMLYTPHVAIVKGTRE